MNRHGERLGATLKGPIHPVAFAACLLLAGLMLVGNVSTWFNWPGNPKLHTTGDSYSEVVARGGITAINVRIALAVRGAVNVGTLDALVLPQDLATINERVEYFGRERQTVNADLVADLLLGKVRREEYDPVLSAPTVDALLAEGSLREYSTHIAVTTAKAADGMTLRLYRDFEGDRFVILPDALSEEVSP